MIKYFITLLILSVSFLSCKKYDEGPFISFRTPESRIVGTWDVEYIYVNNVDSTFYLKSDPCWLPLEFLDKNIYGSNLVSTQSTGCGFLGHYGFTDDKKNLQLLCDAKGWNNIGNFIYEPLALKWHINALTSSDLWIESNYNDVFTWVHLRKVK